jgi:hypothetical protein
VAVVDVVDIGVPAIALTRRRALQLAGTVATGVAVWVYVPALTRGGRLRVAPSLTTSFGDVTVLAASRSAAPLAGGRPLRHGVWRDVLTASVAIGNRLRQPQLLPSGQFRARVLGGPAVTAYDVSPLLLTVPPRSTVQATISFLVPEDGEVSHLEFTEPGAFESRRLGVPAAERGPRGRARIDRHHTRRG